MQTHSEGSEGRRYRQIQMHDDAIHAPSNVRSAIHGTTDGASEAGENRSNVKYPSLARFIVRVRPRTLTMGGR